MRKLASWLLRGVHLAVARPEGMLSASFAVLVIAGTLALRSPLCHGRVKVGWIDALFTSTSAVCVTGLTVVDTGADFNRTGQLAILTLIQLGGLGIMTFAALVYSFFGARLSVRSSVALQDAFYQSPAALRMKRTLRQIVWMTLLLEAVGAVLLYPAFREGRSAGGAAYHAVFHAISAFCNAGFSTFSDNLTRFADRPWPIAVFAALIILGGIGYSVLIEIGARGRAVLTGASTDRLNWSLHAAVVLKTSAVLIVAGALAIGVFGLRSDTSEGWGPRAVGSFFHSVSARTAGFNTVDVGLMPVPTLLVIIGLMYVGGSPGSCAGGVKTTTVVAWLASMWALLRGRDDVRLSGRRLPPDVTQRAFLLIGVALAFNMIGVLALTAFEPAIPLERLLFEQVSAFGTVGLSTGITPHLSDAAKIWLVVTMFVGRLGPITVALAIVASRPPPVRYPEERVLIG